VETNASVARQLRILELALDTSVETELEKDRRIADLEATEHTYAEMTSVLLDALRTERGRHAYTRALLREATRKLEAAPAVRRAA
jgi:hypothetical protein